MAFGIFAPYVSSKKHLLLSLIFSFSVGLIFSISLGFCSSPATVPSGEKALVSIPNEVFRNVDVRDIYKDSHFIEEVFELTPRGFEKGEPLRFCLLTDIHENQRMAKMAVCEANTLEGHFNVFTGDLTDLFDQNQVDKIVKELKVLKGPLIPCMGNHERMGGTYDRYIRQFGLPNYAFTIDGYFFVVLDSSRGFLSQASLAWLDRTLSKGASNKGRFIFTHVPVVDPRPEESHCLASSSGAKLEALMVKHEVGAVFTGHIHQAMDIVRDGVKHVSSGLIGGRLYNLPQEGSYRHVVLVYLVDSEIEAIRYPIGEKSTAWTVWTGELKMKRIYSQRLKQFKDNPAKAERYEKRLQILEVKFKRYEDTLARDFSLSFDKDDWLQKAMLHIKEQPSQFQEELANHLESIVAFRYDR